MNGLFYFRQGGWSVHLVVDVDLGQSVDRFVVDVGWSVEEGIEALCLSLQDARFLSDECCSISAE